MAVIRLTLHAENMLLEREILREWVEQVLRSPARTEPDMRHPGLKRAFGRIDEAGGKMRRVVYTDTDDEHRVITVFFDRDAVETE